MNENAKNTDRSAREDAILIRAFQEGDKAVFDELVLKHQHKLFNLCYRLSGDYQEANDAAQETFMKVYESLRKFRFESAFSTWLYRIAVNICKNKFRSLAYRQEKKTVSLDNPGLTEDDDSTLEIRDDTHSPARELEKKERMRAIEEAISMLPPEQKAVVTLHDIEGFSYGEIVQITGTALGTVKSRLARARLDLRKRLRSVMQDELR
jgi:RNA polymerase sigma-70 factor (ECF subfamily)